MARFTPQDRKYIAAVLNELMELLPPAVYADTVEAFGLYMSDDNTLFDEQRFIKECYAERHD